MSITVCVWSQVVSPEQKSQETEPECIGAAPTWVTPLPDQFYISSFVINQSSSTEEQNEDGDIQNEARDSLRSDDVSQSQRSLQSRNGPSPGVHFSTRRIGCKEIDHSLLWCIQCLSGSFGSPSNVCLSTSRNSTDTQWLNIGQA